MKNNNFKKILEKIEGNSSISDIFHKESQNKTVKKISVPTDILESWKTIYFKTYPRFKKIKLLNYECPKNKCILNIIKERSSVRKFLNKSISMKEISYLLFWSCGLTNPGKTLNDSRRPYPSAGARYPLEIYLITLNCQKINRGLYHYNVKDNSLELLMEKDLTKWVLKTTFSEKWVAEASVIFIITGVLDRTRIKYGDRGYRYILIEAGHVGQNISLLTTWLGLGSCCLGGFIDEDVNRLLDLDLQKEKVLYLIAVGHK